MERQRKGIEIPQSACSPGCKAVIRDTEEGGSAPLRGLGSKSATAYESL